MKIGFIGAGKVGKALGLYFKNHDLTLAGYYSRTSQSAQKAAQITGTNDFKTIDGLAKACDLLLITTTDHALEDIDRQVSASLLNNQSTGAHKIWLHVSGALASDCLSGIKAAGGSVGSMHPLLSFGDEPAQNARRLEETWFSIEGMGEAMEAVKNILNKTGGVYNMIAAEKKALYHAGACVISNYLVTLLDCGMKLMQAAGMDEKTLFQAVQPLIDATLKNIEGEGAVNALTGPIVRADYNTLSVHLEAIAKELPDEERFYRSLALSTVQMIQNQRLNEKQAKIFQKLLRGSGHNEQ